LKAYRQHFDAIAALIIGSQRDLPAMSLGDITTEAMRGAFTRHAEAHAATSIQRCWSTWNVLCTFLNTSELLPANPMPVVGRPKTPDAPKEAGAKFSANAGDGDRFGTQTAGQRLGATRSRVGSGIRAGRLRADKLFCANVGDVRRSDDGAVIHVRAKGGKDRRILIEPALAGVLENNLDGPPFASAALPGTQNLIVFGVRLLHPFL
jgi:site-specific recombinase XerC